MKSQTKHILSAAVLLASVLFGSLTNTYAAGEQEQYHIIYHDQNGSVIKRIPFTADYKFDEDVPPFFVELPYKNVAWTTEPHGEGTRYDKNSDPITSLTEDFNVYAELKKGHFVRFDSLGGTPVEYQFVLPGGKVIKPTDPTKAGYSFNNWSLEGGASAFDFNSVIEKDTKLIANWTGVSTTYTVQVWREKAEYGANGATVDDYDYAGSYTESGCSGENVTFTFNAKSTNLKPFTYTNDSKFDFQIFFYDDNYGSNAQNLTTADIDRVNSSGGIAGDGTTVLNIYLRRAQYNFILKDERAGKSESYSATIRDGETIEHWVYRKGFTLSEDFKNLCQTDLDTEPCHISNSFSKGGTVKLSTTYDGILFQQFFSSLKVATRVSDVIGDSWKFTYSLKTFNRGTTKFRRRILTQTLASAKNPSSPKQYDVSDMKTFLRADGAKTDGFTSLINEGFSIFAVQLKAKESGTELHSIFVRTDPSSGTNTEVKSGYYENPDGRTSISGAYYPAPCVIEYLYTRNAYALYFQSNMGSAVVIPPINGIFFEEALSYLKDKVKYTDKSGAEHQLIPNETVYVDDKLVQWHFKGWYDNELFLGDPIDFATTTRKMPASNLTLYAKWEPKTIKAEYDGNGGKVEGQDKIEKEQPSGVIPERPADPVPPEGMFFYCWTVNGKVYDFQDPITDDTELVALYYNDTKTNKVTYDAGLGTGDVPVDSNNYLIDANAGVLSPGDALVPPVGQKFLNWTDEEGRSYTPGQDVIIKGDVTLKAAFSGLNAGIIIRRKGLIANDKVTESATYQIFKDGAAVPMMVVSLTGKDASGSVVSTSISRLALGTYTVKESSWTWAYDIGETKVIDGDTTVTSDTPGTGTGELKEDHTLIFDFTGEHKEEVSKHDEAVVVNKFGNVITPTVDVKAWNDGGKKKITF